MSLQDSAAPSSFTRRALMAMWPAFLSLRAFAQRRSSRVLFGTSGKVSKGIYTATWDEATGKLGPIELAAEVKSPTFLAIRKQGARTLVFSVSETAGADAIVTSFELAKDGRTLRRISAQPTGGDAPTHLSISPAGGVLAVANYSGGSATSYRIGKDGALSAPVSHFQYSGQGPNPKRQEKPHAHSAQFSPDGRFLLVNDLGLDRIHIYAVNESTGELAPAATPFWSAKPGSGPRHIAFHPNGRMLYSVNELDSTVDILRWDSANGVLTSVGRVSTLPQGFPPDAAFAGEIVLSSNGRNLYVGNRVAADTVAVFAVENDGASLKLVQLASNGGKNTRHVALDPGGPWVLLSNQGSGAVVVLKRDSAGRLSAPQGSYPLDTVMFAAFL